MSIERRAALELRAGGDGKSPRLAGHAVVWDAIADLGQFDEVVRRGAFSRSLASNADPLALVAHQPELVLGRRSAGTLTLREDDRGLQFEVVPPDTQAARDLLVSIKRGDVKGCSFAFAVAPNGESWSMRGTKPLRELRDLNLLEVTICAQPAYPQTDVAVAMRSYSMRFVPPPRLRAAMRWLESCQ